MKEDKISELVKAIEESQNITIPTTKGYYLEKRDKWFIFCPHCNNWHFHGEALKTNKTKMIDVVRFSHCYIGSYRIKGDCEITQEMFYDTQRKKPYGPNNLPKLKADKIKEQQDRIKKIIDDSDRKFIEMHDKLFPKLKQHPEK